MNSVVLDASALLAVILKERGHDLVVPVMRGAIISAVNYSEVLKKMTERGSPLAVTQTYLENLLLTVLPFDQKHAVESAKIWPESRAHGLSFADRACLTLGMIHSAIVVTADQRWAETGLNVEVMVIRKAVA